MGDPLLDGVPRDGAARVIVAATGPITSPAASGAVTAVSRPVHAHRTRWALTVLPTVVAVRRSLRRSDNLEAAVARLVVHASVQRALAPWPGQGDTDDAVRDALRILGKRDDDQVVRAVAMFVLAVRQDWPAQLICGVAAAAGLRRVHAWFAGDDCVIGDLEPQPWVHYGEQFSLEHRPQRRRAPLGAARSRPSLHLTD